MNYIWVPLVDAIERGYDTAKIRYRVKEKEFQTSVADDIIRYNASYHKVSPWLEYLPYVLYDPSELAGLDEKYMHVEINPFQRFNSIFEEILNPERNDENDLILCDIITHILAELDRICGMSSRDFRVLEVMKALDDGCYGFSDVVGLFTTSEKRALADHLITLSETGDFLKCLETLFCVIMTDIRVLCRPGNELVFWIPYQPSTFTEEKLEFIIYLFLPIDYPYTIHQKYTYGVIEHDESIRLEEFVL